MSHSLTTSGLEPDPTAEVTARIEELSSVEVKRILQLEPDKFAVIYQEYLYAGPNAGRRAGRPMLTVVTRNGELDGKWHLRCYSMESANDEFDKIVAQHTWIQWPGGECPLPEGTRVNVRYRNGQEILNLRALVLERRLEDASCAFWMHENSPLDIVAYQLVAKEAA